MLNVKYKTANRWLRLLELDQLLEVTKRGTRGGGNDDIDESAPSPQERYQQTHAFCLILAGVAEIKSQIAREDNERLLYPS